MNNFHHSGELGDIIYSLPIVRALGGGNFYISNEYSGMPLNTKFDQNLFDNVKEILKPLPYINDVCFDFPRGEFIDLNVFRKGFEDWIAGKLTDDQAVLIRTTNIISLYEQHFKPELIDKYATGNVSSSTWLFANKTPIENKPIIINRTHRYNNINFPWKQIIQRFGDECGFVGYDGEHESFCNDISPVEHVKTDTLKDLIEIINGSKVFIGNQSFCYSLCQGLKKYSILETDGYMNNCTYKRCGNLVESTDIDTIIFYIKKKLDKHGL